MKWFFIGIAIFFGLTAGSFLMGELIKFAGQVQLPGLTAQTFCRGLIVAAGVFIVWDEGKGYE